jgi:hypothetical protein
MTTKRVVIEFDDDGNCTIEGHIGGPECDRIVGELERLLGVTTQRTRKPEYRQVAIDQQKAR